MKPRLRFIDGLWWIGPLGCKDYFLWACCAPTVREVCGLWKTTKQTQSVSGCALSAAQS